MSITIKIKCLISGTLNELSNGWLRYVQKVSFFLISFYLFETHFIFLYNVTLSKVFKCKNMTGWRTVSPTGQGLFVVWSKFSFSFSLIILSQWHFLVYSTSTSGLFQNWPDSVLAWFSFGLIQFWTDSVLAWFSFGLIQFWPNSVLA